MLLRLAGVCLFAACGCCDRNPAPRLIDIHPSIVSSQLETEVTLRGANLYDWARVDLSSGRPKVERGWRVELDGSDVELLNVRRIDPETLRFTVPVGVAAHSYDVIATAPNGSVARLPPPRRLVVTADLSALAPSIETAADGGGERVLDRTLRPGELLELFAVLRDASGAFLSGSAAVDWELSGVGSLSAARGPSTRFSAAGAGEAWVSARADNGVSARTGRLLVVDPEQTLDPKNLPPGAALTIEDAAGGSGRAVAARALTVDGVLELFAVLRAAGGAFLFDVAADWSVSGGIGDAPSETASRFELQPRRPGNGRVEARFGELRAETGQLEVGAGRARTLELSPDQVTLTAGGEALQFALRARDAGGNDTGDFGELSWSILDGELSELDPESGLFSPQRAGRGHIRATSSYGPEAQSGWITVNAGRAVWLSIEGPTSTTLIAGGAPVALSASGLDAFGNPTEDVGVLHWQVVGDAFGDLDPDGGVLTPLAAGSGEIQVQSSYGASGVSPAISVLPGALASLTLQPSSATLSADDAALQFSAIGRDAFGNATGSVGMLTYGVANGTLSGLSASGLLDPGSAGSGRVRVTSSLGVAGVSGLVEVVPGRAATLAFSPASLTTMVGDPATQFSATGQDQDGNPTSDLGTLQFTIASGPISAIAASGLFTPASAGDGKLRVSSSYGASALSGTIHVDSFTPRVQILAVRGSDLLTANQTAARFEFDVRNDSLSDVLSSGLYFSMYNESINSDVSDEYSFVADYRNVDRLPPNATTTLVYYAGAASSISNGFLTLTASLDAFFPGGFLDTVSKDFATGAWNTASGPAPVITGPLTPDNRACIDDSKTLAANIGAVSSPVYKWLYPGGTLSGGSQSAPDVEYSQAGAFPFSLEVTDSFGRHGNALSPQPIFVGQSTGVASLSYPTGSLVFSSPSSGLNIDMSTLPRSDLISSSSSQPLVQCDGNAVASSGARYVTLSLDRGQLDPSADDHPELPGIQVDLDQGNGYFTNVGMRNDDPRLEGAATLYGEYFHPNLQRVTAAGFSAFQFIQDLQAPSVIATWPADDCGSGCIAKNQIWIFRFSEAMDVTALGNVRVERLNGSACNGTVNSNVTGSSTLTYFRTSHMLHVLVSSSVPAGAIVRVTLPAQATDSAANPNPLVPLVRCAGLSAVAIPAATQAPQVNATASSFSPDGDGAADSIGWNVAVDAAARYIYLRVVRGASLVWARSEIVDGAGIYPLSWDGRDSDGRRVFPGVYRWDAYAVNAAGVLSASVSGAIEVTSALHYVGVPRRY